MLSEGAEIIIRRASVQFPSKADITIELPSNKHPHADPNSDFIPIGFECIRLHLPPVNAARKRIPTRKVIR